MTNGKHAGCMTKTGDLNKWYMTETGDNISGIWQRQILKSQCFRQQY